jgi:hypothetical protein
MRNRQAAFAAGFSHIYAALFPQAEPGYDLLITLDVFFAHILEQSRPCPDHFQQTPPGCVIFAMSLEMLGEIVDPLCQQCNLYVRRTGIALVRFIILNNTTFFLLRQHLSDKSFLECPSQTYLIPTIYEIVIILAEMRACKGFPKVWQKKTKPEKTPKIRTNSDSTGQVCQRGRDFQLEGILVEFLEGHLV